MSHLFDQEISFKSLSKFTVPIICGMVFMSMYTIVDGAFVSNFIGTNALSATNLVYPFINFILGISIMMATGGSAIVMKKVGEKNTIRARKDFSLIIMTTAALGLIIMIIGMVFIEPIIYILGSTDLLYDYCRDYLFYSLIFTVPMVVKFVVEQFMVAEGYSKLAFISTVIGGVTNIILDYLFIVTFSMGIKGAAIATGLGYLVSCIIGIVFFLNKDNQLHLVKPIWDGNMLINTCTNGSSEMVTQVSNGIITFLFNKVMLSFLGEDGVASITIVLYTQFLLSAIYIGYSIGIGPIISYQYGAKNHEKLRKIVKISIKFITSIAALTVIISLLSAPILVGLFSKEGTTVYNITISGFKLFAISFLFVGVNIFIGGMFTALSNGKISAFLSFNRTLVLVIVGIVVLPMMLGVNGVWLSVPFAECISIIISITLFRRYKNKYQY